MSGVDDNTGSNTDNALLARIDERTKDMAKSISGINRKLDGLPCTPNSIKLAELDNRLKPLENIFWKLVLAAISLGSLFGFLGALGAKGGPTG